MLVLRLRCWSRSSLLVLRLHLSLGLGLITLLITLLRCGGALLILRLRLRLIPGLLLVALLLPLLLARNLEFELDVWLASVLGISPPSGHGPLHTIDKDISLEMRTTVIRVLLVLVLVREH